MAIIGPITDSRGHLVLASAGPDGKPSHAPN